MNKEAIYTITTFEKMEEDKRKGGSVLIGAFRVAGFYHDFKDAETAVRENMCDLYETVYSYAMIEKVDPGLYPWVHERWLYNYNKDIAGYERMEEPSYLKHIDNFSIG